MTETQQNLVELAGRLVVGLEGPRPSVREWSWLRKWQPAGVILFSRNVLNFSQLNQLCSQLKKLVPGLQIMTDHEGGPVSQMAAAVGRPPVAFGLGVRDDTDLTRRVHLETGRRLKAAGIDWVLAPCADVLSEPRNPVIGSRAFGSDSSLVARHVAAAVQGLTQGNISCCLKHWPGHGSSHADSHLESTVVTISGSDEEPFVAGLKAGAGAVMPGHLLTGEDSWPATLSRDFLSQTRRKLSAEPILLIADDISMGALRDPMARLGISSDGEGMVDVDKLPVPWFVRLAEAGCDWLLVRAIPSFAFPVENMGKSEGPPPDGPSILNPAFDEKPYLEARSQPLEGFLESKNTLVSLDLARQDRWQVAGGLDFRHWQRWDSFWAERFMTVLGAFDLNSAIAGEADVERLLVACHRPLPENWKQSPWAQSLFRRKLSSGACLVMGHPSLKDEIKGFLGADWNVTPMYDVGCDELGA